MDALLEAGVVAAEGGDVVLVPGTRRTWTIAVDDKSMEPELPAGTEIDVVLGATPEPGDPCLVRCGRELLLRRYRPRVGGVFDAEAVNPAFPTLRSDQDSLSLFAAVVEARPIRRYGVK